MHETMDLKYLNITSVFSYCIQNENKLSGFYHAMPPFSLHIHKKKIPNPDLESSRLLSKMKIASPHSPNGQPSKNTTTNEKRMHNLSRTLSFQTSFKYNSQENPKPKHHRQNKNLLQPATLSLIPY